MASVFETAITQLLGKLGIDEEEAEEGGDIQDYEFSTTTSY